ncbi:MAG: restriction endonuclease subunit S [Dolichospermum sp.]
MIKKDDASFEGGKGNLPNGWKWVKLGDVCHTTSGGTPSRAVPSYYGGDIAWVKSGDLNDGLIYETEESITQEAITNSSAKKFPAGTLLVAMYGATVGKLGILAIEAATNQAVCGIFCDELLIDRNYLFYYIRQQRKNLIESSFGGAQPNISQDIIRAVKIPLPPLDEQKRIAAILNKKMEAVEKARESAIAQLEAAKALTAAYLRSVFNSPEARKTSSDGWKWVKLGDVCEINPSRPRNLKRGDEELTSFVPMSAVDGKLGIIANSEIKKFATVRKGYTYFAKGDVLFAKITPCMENGKHAIAKNLIDDIGFGTTEFHVIRPGDKITSDWVHKFVRQPEVCKKASNFFIGSVGQQRVPAEFLVNIKIPLPPLDEQKRIATILNEKLTEAEKLCKVLEEQLENINKLPAAFLRQAFNGEL